jgi:hypothetical protein
MTMIKVSAFKNKAEVGMMNIMPGDIVAKE